MKKLTLALVALGAGAAAVYFLDPRQGPRRRAALGERLAQWQDAAVEQVQGGSQDASERLHGLTAQLRGWVGRALGRAEAALPGDDDGLEPLNMTPPPLEREHSHRGGVLLAMAAPVAMAVGAAWLRRRDDGHWIH
ncbi:hypothetical protein [Ideonella sp. BN130291]|uniref:hypothetical protein n=1 Tax=Ideonella sp. BN130291 TaxID=3112940 RepID=UPI002E25BD5A|nr:hypothetical protein [Ideonella sp. BN130291]